MADFASTGLAGLKMSLLTSLVSGVNRLMRLTYRTEVLDPTCQQRRMQGEDIRGIYAAWHCVLWHGPAVLEGQGACAMVSAHRDGELAARFLARQGFTLVRGSSTRGGAKALREFVRVAREAGRDLCVTVDGPRGPAREVKDGILLAASLSGLPIIPLGCWVERAWRLKSWDRFIIGKPFTRVRIAMGPPLRVPRDLTREDLIEIHKPRLAKAMAVVEERARDGRRA